jgi:hypothetical protein
MTHTDTLAQVGYRARRIEELPWPKPTKEDHDQVAGECLTFLDACAAEAAFLRWFPANNITHRRRSRVRECVLDALREHGPLTAVQIQPIIGHERSATETALRELLKEGLIVVTGRTPTMGRARIYGLPEGGDE